jgi:hypothetical protein
VSRAHLPGTLNAGEAGNQAAATRGVGAFWRRPSLVIAFVTASLSGVVVLLHALQWVTLTYTITILAPLSAVVFIALLFYARRGREQILLNRLAAGLLAGAMGLVAYDLVRLVILLAGVPFNPFRPIEVFGLLILDRYQDTTLTKAVGWGFHIWNGLAFAVMYTLTLGRGRMPWAIGWSMVLEGAMLSSYPSLFQIVRDWAFVLVSLVGHLCYGLALGATARRTVKW